MRGARIDVDQRCLLQQLLGVAKDHVVGQEQGIEKQLNRDSAPDLLGFSLRPRPLRLFCGSHHGVQRLAGRELNSVSLRASRSPPQLFASQSGVSANEMRLLTVVSCRSLQRLLCFMLSDVFKHNRFGELVRT